MLRACLVLLFLLPFSQSFANERINPACPQVLDVMYRGFTLENLDHSYERLMNKFLLAIYYANANRNNTTQNQERLRQALNQARRLDSNLQEFIPYQSRPFSFLDWLLGRRYNPSSLPSTQSLEQSLNQWMSLQSSNPEIFQGLPEELRFDDWDRQTVRILNELGSYNLRDSNLRENLTTLSSTLDQTRANLLEGREFNEQALRELVNRTSAELARGMNNSYSDRLQNYSSICSEDELALYIQSENAICPITSDDDSFDDINGQLNELALLINQTGLLSTPEPDINTPEPIYELEYQTNEDIGATFCRRDPAIISQIVLHHTAMGRDIDPVRINNTHLQRESGGEPWYMVSYNYLISETFQGATPESPRVFEGRPIEMKGAHAGGYNAPLRAEERARLSTQQIQCGNYTNGFNTIPALSDSQIDSNDGLSGNLNSVGIALLGNYDPVVIEEIDGIPVPRAVNRDRLISYPSEEMIDKVSKLSCDLQKQYPNITRIVPHSYFKDTECPAAVLLFFETIRTKTQALGCSFEFIITKEQDMRL